MKAKVKATGEIINVESNCDYSNGTFWYQPIDIDDDRTWEPHELEIIPDTRKEVTIEGYVARDKGGGLYLHHTEPTRGTYEWYSVMCPPRPLPTESFPSVTWDSEPLRVKLTLTPME